MELNELRGEKTHETMLIISGLKQNQKVQNNTYFNQSILRTFSVKSSIFSKQLQDNE